MKKKKQSPKLTRIKPRNLRPKSNIPCSSFYSLCLKHAASEDNSSQENLHPKSFSGINVEEMPRGQEEDVEEERG